ncbi:MAG: inositol monophosphatase [Spirulina sp. SIO3F2]|nr:inositol monophosphatase [Spirulina sp. SIO3F2]
MTPTEPQEQLQRYLDIATEAALTAGAILEKSWGNVQSITEKGRPGDLVTEVDKASEEVLLKVLMRHLPEHSILAEESGQMEGESDRYCWAVDPLDGTTNYTHGYPASSVSIGLLIDNQPAVGVVYDPYTHNLYRAATGLGATCNRQTIRVSRTEQLANSLLVTGFAYDRHTTTDNNYAEFCYLTHLTQGVRRGGSAALDLAHVAAGRLDGYWERGLSPWDVTAGIVLVREAGGRVTAYDGSPHNPASGRILATNGQIHQSLSEAIAQTPPIQTWADASAMAMISV